MIENKIFLPYIFITNLNILTNYKFFFIKNLTDIIKFYIPKNIFYKKKKIKFLFNKIYFFFNKIDENIINDNIQKIKPSIQINLPIKLIKLKKFKIKFIFLGEIPIINIDSSIILNGLKKYFIFKLKKNFGIYFLKKYNYNKIIYLIQIILSKFKIIQLEINKFGESKIYLNIKNNININFFLFLNFLGLQNKDIIYFSKYSHSYILKKNLLISLLYYKNLKNKKIFINNLKLLKNYLLFLNINKNLFFFKYLKFFYLNIDFNKTQLNALINNYFFNQNFFLSIELLQIYDLLLDINFKKLSYKTLDHFGNKKLENISDFYNYQFNLIFFRLFKNNLLKKNLYKINLNIKKNFISLKEQLNINPLLQYSDQINVLSEILHNSKLTYINKNLLKNNKFYINLRDIYPSQLGKICIINTNEGEKSGLNVTLSFNVKLNKNNILEASFYKEKKKKPIFFNAFKQEHYQINLNKFNIRKNFIFDNYSSIIIYKNEFKNNKISNKNLFYLKLSNLLSLSENIIPFLIYNDPTRCLLGSKMQTQSIYSLYKNKSYIFTGIENFISNNNFKSIKSIQEGVVSYVSSYKIIIRDIFNREINYFLIKYKYSNQGVVFNLKPIVWVGERVIIGQNLAVNLDIVDNEFNLGNNITIAYGSFFGFEFEDSVIINKDIIYNNIFTSLHIDIYETILYNSSIKLDYSILKLPKYNKYLLRNLNNFGFIKEGSKVLNKDILISKINLKKNKINKSNSIKKFFIYLFGNNIRTIEDNSITLLIGQEGRVIKLEILKKKNKLNLKLFIAKINLLQCGDKISGKYGNKGIISLITESCNLPYNSIGDFPDLISGPLGIPSRMNLGQLYESLLGLSCFFFNNRLLINNEINLFFGSNYIKSYIYQNLNRSFEKNKIYSFYNPYILGKNNLKNGFTGFNLKGSILLGNCYYSKLIHIIKKKIYSRTIGKYSEITQQPLKGRSKEGGQRFGEMEVWALEAFGASYNLREILGYKSDSFKGRYNINKYIYMNNLLELPNIPESFKLIIRELNGLALNINSFILSNYLYGKKIPLNLIF